MSVNGTKNIDARRQLSDYGSELDTLIARVVLRCEAQREIIPERTLTKHDLERIRNCVNRIFTEFYSGVAKLQHLYREDLV